MKGTLGVTATEPRTGDSIQVKQTIENKLINSDRFRMFLFCIYNSIV